MVIIIITPSNTTRLFLSMCSPKQLPLKTKSSSNYDFSSFSQYIFSRLLNFFFKIVSVFRPVELFFGTKARIYFSPFLFGKLDFGNPMDFFKFSIHRVACQFLNQGSFPTPCATKHQNIPWYLSIVLVSPRICHICHIKITKFSFINLSSL